MAGRKLTRRQAWRIEKIQQERLKRAQRKQERDNGPADDAKLGPEQTGRVVANYGASVEVERDDGACQRCAVRQNLETLVVGDQVVWQQPEGSEQGVVTALIPRTTLLARPDASGRVKALAANIDQILVVAAPRPDYDTRLIDQYLIAAETTGITPVIVLNKVDLLDDKSRPVVEADLETYHTIGYPVIYASTVANHGLDDLLSHLQGKTSVFAGQSGVGKSSLIQSLLPETEITVGELHAATGLGRHTTSASRLYHLPGGGVLIDSPGVRDFRLWRVDRQQLADGFREFRPFLGLCRFRDCSHTHEPGCALQEAVAAGDITQRRLDSYLALAAALDEGEEF